MKLRLARARDSEKDSEEDSDEMQQGYLCTSTDPKRIGTKDGETFILNSRELRKTISLQQNVKDQTIWMTTAQEDTYTHEYVNM